MVRHGKLFTSAECLNIAKESVAQSSHPTNQREENMWDRIEAQWRSLYGMNRAAKTIRCTRKRLSRNWQIYLVARESVIKFCRRGG